MENRRNLSDQEVESPAKREEGGVSSAASRRLPRFSRLSLSLDRIGSKNHQFVAVEIDTPFALNANGMTDLEKSGKREEKDQFEPFDLVEDERGGLTHSREGTACE